MFGVDEDAVIKMKKDPANLCNNTSKISPTISLVKVLNEMQVKDVNKMSVKEFNASNEFFRYEKIEKIIYRRPTMKKILVVEDDVDIHLLIKDILEKERYKVISAYSGTEAILLIEKNDIDLILLDLMLPGLLGEEIIKKVKNIPIIVISAKVSLEDKVNTLLSGANDYIVKPFEPKELLARIKVQLRMKNNKENKELKYKDMFLDKMTQTLYIKNNKINLTKTEYAILKQLLLNPKQIITKTKLIQILNENNKVSAETQLYDENSLKVHISNIRKKIRNVTTNEYIESVWGIGFKLYD